ncbi:hypothetical protein [Streptosporangium saharense]|uniref:Uncharacterized protein n=1 Tax=Streptosporangium saharense TaxID=1706840 RepID=A0A7W7QPQ6_9ACTN|nr:hypothetical protein [Streptosporangium saharense]MBB4917512.1 hypothetical protein [Streptosporangium saharense]
MSMRLMLAKIDPEVLRAVRINGDLVGQILGGSSREDGFEDDYLALGVIAEGRAEAEHGDARWGRCYPWLAAATGADGTDDLPGHTFGYGPPFALDPERVVRVARGLAGEGWGFAAARRDGFEGLGPFYAAAAREGRAVVGGVS